MVSRDGVPGKFRHLEGSQRVKKSPEGEFDFVCTLDSSDLERVGDVLEGRLPPDLNIDHHSTNLNFAKINLVDAQAVATTEMLVEFLPQFGLQISPPVAEALLTGLITDTIGFRTSNMRPSALRVAADLMEIGVNLPNLYQLALVNHSYKAMRLWGIGLGNLEKNGRMIWSTISLQDRAAIEYPGYDDADLVNLLGTVEGADIALIFTEHPDNMVKVSWRSQTGFDVSKLALDYGGGGHPAASGASVQGSLAEVKQKILDDTRVLLKQK
jgi:phosphoesterase RecJ-like protein